MELTQASTLLVVGLLITGGGFFLGLSAGEKTYQYTVKSEQISTDAGYTGTATPIENLSDAEQKALFTAYKKSDHFLGESSAIIHLSEPLDLNQDDRWKAVDIEGVHLLVGIHGPDVYKKADIMTFVSTIVTIFGLLMIFMGLYGSGYDL